MDQNFFNDDDPWLTTAAMDLQRRPSTTADLRRLSLDSDGYWPPPTPAALPEFAGRATIPPIFKPPSLSPAHPSPPTPIEFRPRPLRETQPGSFARTIAASNSQLWAGFEHGVRVWDLGDVFKGFGKWKARRGDEGSAPFRESRLSSPVICLVVDEGLGLVWSGHRDGRVRGWGMVMLEKSIAPQKGGDFGEALSWQAHRSPVLSMVITAQGDLWTGSEGGTLSALSSEVISKALTLSPEARQKASVGIERSIVDLRSLVTVGGVCSLPTADVKFLLSDKSSSKVWSASDLSFALWDSRTKELLKILNIDGQVQSRLDSSVQDSYEEYDMKLNFSSTSRKAIGFFQRSRNALIGAADAVRKVAAKGAFGDDQRRTEALEICMDGSVWTGSANGILVQWDKDGHRLQEFHYHSSSIQCLCTYGTRLWVGYLDGTVQVLSLEGKLLGGWLAHDSPIMSIVIGGHYIFTLANHGGIRGWHITSPGPLDAILRSELTNKQQLYRRLEHVKILAGTWNVGQEKACDESLVSWLSAEVSDAGIVVVGLQEVEMGAGVLAMAAAKETVGLEGSPNGQWWLDAIGTIIDEKNSFDRVGSRQLAGLLIAVWARKSLSPYIGDVDAGAVPCGFGRAIGNKGAVGLRMRIYDRKMSFVNCHFAAHLEAVDRRNSDFEHVFQMMSFSRPSIAPNSAAAGAYAAQISRGASTNNDKNPELSEVDMVVFLGDFNYRLYGVTYEEARGLISQRRFDRLRENDQLQSEMKAGRVFQGLREGEIKFPPTYKFERYQSGLSGYDSSEKKRIPAWCDRILYRDSRSVPEERCSLDCPVVSSISKYNSCMDVLGSDHKPVKCLFNVDIAHVHEATRRQELGKIIRSNEKVRAFLAEISNVPEVVVSRNKVILQGQQSIITGITNKSRRQIAIFEISCEGQFVLKENGQSSELCSRSSFGFPYWLEVIPATGIIQPGQTVEVSISHRDTINGLQNTGPREDRVDKLVILRVNVTGTYPFGSKAHRIEVRYESLSRNSSWQETSSRNSSMHETSSRNSSWHETSSRNSSLHETLSRNSQVEPPKVVSRWTPPDLL